eukprot:TRINITY_DN11464_c0_g1_i1.p1 TRINITY_DN11464_c0_g1~~TRINITY_DN11464_c0_g1_i1.p1  ORF type:complete len:262 (+),score=66.85 TRINITY_DN11464_c0_g1_i1:85-870(+)
MSAPKEQPTPATSMPEQEGVPTPTPTATSQAELAPIGQGLFRGHDPFNEFSPDPFESGGMHRVFGSGFGRVTRSLERLSEEILGVRPILPQVPPEAEAEVPTGAKPRTGSYSVQSASMHSFLGKDGKMHTEQYASSDVGHMDHQIRETHQAYSNSRTGMQKRALEQHLGDRGMKTVKHQAAGTTETKTTEMFLGMDATEESKETFNKDFAAKAEHLPEHQSFGGEFFRGFGLGGGALKFPAIPGAGGWAKSALESGSQGGA